MMGRGEDRFAKAPRLSASLYDRLMQFKAMELQLNQIARELVFRINRGRLLDVGILN